MIQSRLVFTLFSEVLTLVRACGNTRRNGEGNLPRIARSATARGEKDSQADATSRETTASSS